MLRAMEFYKFHKEGKRVDCSANYPNMQKKLRVIKE